MSDRQILDTLIAGRALIERPERWVQHHSRVLDLEGVNLQRCAGSACSDALGVDGTRFLPLQWSQDGGLATPLLILGYCLNELRLAIPLPWRRANRRCGIVGYNDHPDTTHADIIAVFDRAIGTVRARIECTELALGMRTHPSIGLESYEGLLVAQP